MSESREVKHEFVVLVAFPVCECGGLTVVRVANRFNLSEADGESLEKQIEFDMAQAEVADYYVDAKEKIDTYKRR